jgi:predicted dithiol-disulfide oxidoreductase (DUF899 family)
MTDKNMKNHPVVSRTEWLAARAEHLAKEKEFTRLRDRLSQQRRDLPWVRVEEEYIFDSPKGKETLADLFEERSQLVVYHFMLPRTGMQAVHTAPSGPTILMASVCI